MADVTSSAEKAPRMRLGFSRDQRVRDRQDFQRIQGRGMRLGGRLLLLLVMKQPGAPRKARLGITASKKSGESVQRSRIKRLVREVFRLNQALFPAGHDFVVIAREGADKLTLQEVTAEMLGALKRLKDGGARPQQDRGPRPPHGKKPGKPQPKR